MPRWIWQRARWPAFRWDMTILAEPLAAARRAQGRALGVSALLDPALDLAVQLELGTREGLATSAIEGEHFDPVAMRSSMARRLGVSTAGMPPASRATDALVEILVDATAKHAEPVTVARLCAWQAALFPTGRSGLHRVRTGRLRGAAPMRIVSGPIGRERVHFEAPPHDRLSHELAGLVTWIEATPTVDGVLRAGLAHAWFEVLHPFEDGNGRVGRALADLLLARDERKTGRVYSLSARLMRVRDEYYAELERFSSGDLDATPWLAWFARQVEASAHETERVLAEVLRKSTFFARHARARLNERQQKVLGRMLDAGPDGFEGGMTNKKYARLTRTSAATAQRDLAALVEAGCLRVVGGGRSVRYELRD